MSGVVNAMVLLDFVVKIIDLRVRIRRSTWYAPDDRGSRGFPAVVKMRWTSATHAGTSGANLRIAFPRHYSREVRIRGSHSRTSEIIALTVGVSLLVRQATMREIGVGFGERA